MICKVKGHMIINNNEVYFNQSSLIECYKKTMKSFNIRKKNKIVYQTMSSRFYKYLHSNFIKRCFEKKKRVECIEKNDVKNINAVH
jgi:hypothetical protein